MAINEMCEKIKELLIDSLELDAEPEDIGDEDQLFGSHLGLDSVSTLTLVEELEDEFEIEVEDEELTPELFESVKSLAEYVVDKMKENAE